MRIALLGYGKMNQLIEKMALAQGHLIGLKINSENIADLNPQNLAKIDIAIDFSSPVVVLNNIEICIKNNLPVVVGTTAWLEYLPTVQKWVSEYKASLFYASNFSLGVNILFKINALLAQLLAQNADYRIEMTEIHHVHKLDSPSGTAIELAKAWINPHSRFDAWALAANINHNHNNPLIINALRQPEVVGTHILTATSEIDTMTISHQAHSRQGFAQGALAAAAWLKDKNGIFTMDDLLANP